MRGGDSGRGAESLIAVIQHRPYSTDEFSICERLLRKLYTFSQSLWQSVIFEKVMKPYTLSQSLWQSAVFEEALKP